MNFQKIDSRHYKRSDYKKGSNQHKKRKKLTVRGFLALLVFTTVMGVWAFDTASQKVVADAPVKELTKPIPENEYVLASRSATPTLSPKEKELWKKQIEKDALIIKSMEITNARLSVVESRVKGGTN